eukprot:1521158-Pyramimonas_sp.AAC.1
MKYYWFLDSPARAAAARARGKAYVVGELDWSAADFPTAADLERYLQSLAEEPAVRKSGYPSGSRRQGTLTEVEGRVP